MEQSRRISQAGCDLDYTLVQSAFKMVQEVSRRLGGIPMYAIDMVAGGNAEKDPKLVNYVCNQIEEGITLARESNW